MRGPFPFNQSALDICFCMPPDSIHQQGHVRMFHSPGVTRESRPPLEILVVTVIYCAVVAGATGATGATGA